MPIDVSFFNTTSTTPVSFAPFSVTPSKPPSPSTQSAATTIPIPASFSVPQSQTTTMTRPETTVVMDTDDIASNHKALQVRALEMQLQTERAQVAELESTLQTTVASKEQVWYPF